MFAHRRSPWPVALLCVALLFAAVACGQQATPTVVLPEPTSAAPAVATPAPAAARANGPLIVLDWSGYELEDFWGEFKAARPDFPVEYTFFAEDAEAFAKLQTGFVADLVHPGASWIKLYVDNDLILPIDTSRLKNWPYVMPELAKLFEMDGKQYGIPWEWGYDSILVRTDKVTDPIDSWNDLWDPKYAGHVSIFDSAEGAVVAASLALGYDPYALTDAQLEEVKQKLIALKPNLLGYWVDYTEINQQVASGDVWLAANTWPDAYKTVMEQGVPVDYVTPREGRVGWVYCYSVVKRGKNHDLAMEFIDALIARDSLVNMATMYGYGTARADANAQVVATLDANVARVLQIDSPETLSKTMFLKALTEKQRADWTRVWDDVKAAP